MEIPVRMNLMLPILMGATSALNLFTFLLTGNPMQLALTVVFALLAGLQSVQPVFVWTGSAFENRNALGMTMKTHEVSDPSLVRIEGNEIYYDDQKLYGSWSTMFARNSDWEKLKQALGRAG